MTATAARFRAAIGLATILMLALSWPLWVEGGSDFPRVPFVGGLPAPTAWASWGMFAALLAMIAAGIIRRRWMGAAAALFLALILGDQHRFQPWAYQFLMAALAMAATSGARAAGLCRLFLIALYFHSGMSKLDVSFCDELGLRFLETAAGPFGLHPSAWPVGPRRGAVLAMPIAELVIAVGLAIRRTRRVALVGAIGLHAALLAILGPWGLGHSPIVLVWNAALIVEVLILFGAEETRDSPVDPRSIGGPSGWAWVPLAACPPVLREGRDTGGQAASGTRGEAPSSIVSATFVLAAILPFGERWGWFDTWPSFALYASHVERVEVSVPEGQLDALPGPIRRFARGEGPWRRIDLTAWSRSGRGVPAYPQGRAVLGVAEGLVARYPGARAVRVDLGGRADRWTGRREWAVAVGAEAIRRLGDRYRLNAHPAPGTAVAR